jgi:hypothetical protein
MKSNYKEIKNYIHNEAEITKDELRAMIKDAIEIEVKQIVEAKRPHIDQIVDTYSRQYINAIIHNGISDGGRLLFGFKERVSSSLSDAVGKYIADQLTFEIKVKEDKNED